MLLSFGLDVLVEHDLVPHVMRIMEEIANTIEDLFKTKKVLMAKLKLEFSLSLA